VARCGAPAHECSDSEKAVDVARSGRDNKVGKTATARAELFVAVVSRGKCTIALCGRCWGGEGEQEPRLLCVSETGHPLTPLRRVISWQAACLRCKYRQVGPGQTAWSSTARESRRHSVRCPSRQRSGIAPCRPASRSTSLRFRRKWRQRSSATMLQGRTGLRPWNFSRRTPVSRTMTSSSFLGKLDARPSMV